MNCFITIKYIKHRIKYWELEKKKAGYRSDINQYCYGDICSARIAELELILNKIESEKELNKKCNDD